jgi:hypothetical protein
MHQHAHRNLFAYYNEVTTYQSWTKSYNLVIMRALSSKADSRSAGQKIIYSYGTQSLITVFTKASTASYPEPV